MQNNESGRSMMEMLGVLGIMGILIFGAVTGINSGMTSYRINRVYSDIHETIQAIQDMYLAVYGRNQYPKTLNCNDTEFRSTITSKHCTDKKNCKTVEEYIGKYGTDGDGNPNVKNCISLFKNDIQTREMKITVAGSCSNELCSELKISYTTPNEDFCTRLKDMDWALISIDVSGTCNEEGSSTLTFSPK